MVANGIIALTFVDGFFVNVHSLASMYLCTAPAMHETTTSFMVHLNAVLTAFNSSKGTGVDVVISLLPDHFTGSSLITVLLSAGPSAVNTPRQNPTINTQIAYRMSKIIENTFFSTSHFFLLLFQYTIFTGSPSKPHAMCSKTFTACTPSVMPCENRIANTGLIEPFFELMTHTSNKGTSVCNGLTSNSFLIVSSSSFDFTSSRLVTCRLKSISVGTQCNLPLTFPATTGSTLLRNRGNFASLFRMP
mmetsp:Transcript_3146/g.9721  ORF Transcript_3146/g.9721 Transcript_3146/m.9721 type:complete len:247 (+) Transcript_3146:2946-3686(+)